MLEFHSASTRMVQSKREVSVLKEELVGRMQFPLSTDGVVPPWLGMYGFGEFARLGGASTYHNYTTALRVISRHAQG